MKTNYTSVPVIASVIGSVSRKAMYLVHPTSIDGEKIYKDTWIPIQWTDSNNQVQRIDWEPHSQSLIELNMSKASRSMIIDQSNIVKRLVNSKVQSYLELNERIIVYIPTWMLTKKRVIENNIEKTIDPIISVKYTRAQQQEEDLFTNDNEYYGVAEEFCQKSYNTNYIKDRAESTYSLQFASEDIDSVQQWEMDNPEYLSYE
jgi:hypothetical protein